MAPIGGVRSAVLSDLEDGGIAIPDSVTNQWPMDEGSGSTVEDIKGTRDLTLEGPSWDDGYLLFDGTDDFATDDNDDSYFTDVSDFSVFGWLRPTSTEQGGFLGSYSVSGGQRSWQLRWVDRDDVGENQQLEILYSRDGSEAITDHSESYSYDWEVDSWFSFAITRDGDTGNIRFYHDGEHRATADGASGSINANTRKFALGGVTDRSSPHFEGYMRDTVFAKETTLSNDDISDLHSATE